jgi:CPA2 family monovalent cation:H+ antiporter-2
MYKLLPILEKELQRLPVFWKRLEANRPLPEIQEHQLVDHVVIIGYGRVGEHMVNVLQSLNVSLLVIESDVERIEALNSRHVATLYGDASNSEVITHARLDHARALVITVPEESSVFMIAASAKILNPNLPMIVRAGSREAITQLANLGVNHIVHPELEGGLEIIHHTLIQLGFPLREVHEYAEAVRRDGYDIRINTTDEHRSLHDLLIATDSIEISWVCLKEESPLVGKTLFEANIRSQTGASVIGLIRDNHLIANPKSVTDFKIDDRVGLIGETDQIEVARNWLNGRNISHPASETAKI